MKQNEESWILTGGTHRRLFWGYMSHRSEGHPGSVNFPYKWVNQREELENDVVGFYHTHPCFIASPSPRDDATMAQWVLSFGKPLICLIEGINGLKGYLYYSDEQPPIPIRTIKSFGQLIVGIMPKKPLVTYNLSIPYELEEIRDGEIELPENFPFHEGQNAGHAIDWDEQDLFFSKTLKEMVEEKNGDK
jgi:hypothetical protein